ncbi:MAG: hypothetical protein PHV53_11585 [Fermentimonas sp.]|nr:hypothetical protein [Fermentimonas sp.]
MVQQVNDSFTVILLSKGDSPTVFLEANPLLWQGISSDGLTIVPDFKIPANQPVIKPKILSSLQSAYINIIPESDRWWYNDQELTFDANGNVTAPTAYVGLFKRDKVAGTLKVIDNLVSMTNKTPDTIKFEGVIETGGTTTVVSHTIRVQIEEMAGSTYSGQVQLSSTTIDAPDAVITATARLFAAAAEITTGFQVNYYEAVPLSQNPSGWEPFKPGSGKVVTIGAVDVDSRQLFKADFIVNSNVVSTVIFAIYDTQDPYMISMPFKTKYITKDESTTATLSLIDRKTGATVSGVTWEMWHQDTLGRIVDISTPVVNNVVTIKGSDLEQLNNEGEKIGSIRTYITATK